MYLYDYNNGKIEVGGGSVEVNFYVSDSYSFDYECPLCDGNGTVTATELESENEHEIQCPHCSGDGRIYDDVFIEEESCEEVEVSGKRVGAYGDNNLSYDNRQVCDRIDDDVFKRTIEKAIAKRKAERMASLTTEELEKIGRVHEMESELAEMMKQFQEAKALVESIFEDGESTTERPLAIGDRVRVTGHDSFATIETIDNSNVPIMVRFESGYSNWYRLDQITRIEI